MNGMNILMRNELRNFLFFIFIFIFFWIEESRMDGGAFLFYLCLIIALEFWYWMASVH